MIDYLETGRVAKPYWPERLELVEALPRTPSGRSRSSSPRAGPRARDDMTTTATTPDALQTKVRAYVENEGERWSEQIEREHRVPLELWDELRDRGYLGWPPRSSTAAPESRSPAT